MLPYPLVGSTGDDDVGTSIVRRFSFDAVQKPLSFFVSVFSSFARIILSFLAASRLDIADALTHLIVAASHDNRFANSSDN